MFSESLAKDLTDSGWTKTPTFSELVIECSKHGEFYLTKRSDSLWWAGVNLPGLNKNEGTTTLNGFADSIIDIPETAVVRLWQSLKSKGLV
jgi:hypothetical protein